MTRRLLALLLTLAIAFGVTTTIASTAEARGKVCHTAYTVYGHWVAGHWVKATAKHSAYYVYRHYIPTHIVKANCPK